MRPQPALTVEDRPAIARMENVPQWGFILLTVTANEPNARPEAIEAEFEMSP